MKKASMKKLNWDTFILPSLILAPALTWLVLQLVGGSGQLNERVVYWVCGASLVVVVVYGTYSRWQLTRQRRRRLRDKER